MSDWVCSVSPELLNRSTVFKQTWYGGVLSWARMLYKKTGLLSSRSRSQQGSIWSKYDNFYYTFWTADLFATILGLIVHYHKPEGFNGEIGLLCSRSRSQQSFKMSMNVCPDDIFWFAEPFTTKLGMVMRYYELDCLCKRLVCCLQGQGHSQEWYDLNMTF